MNYYEDEQNVAQYSKFTPAHDGTLLVDILSAYLPEGSSLLELGMGPGKDLQLLAQHFRVTGSDLSHLFLEKYRAQHASADLMHLDARTLDTERTFDAIFSNKALIHLSVEELQQSFDRQHAVLNERGLVMHSFWCGEGQNEFGGLTLVYHNEQDLTEMLEPAFEVLVLERHAKMADGDSIYMVARKK